MKITFAQRDDYHAEARALQGLRDLAVRILCHDVSIIDVIITDADDEMVWFQFMDDDGRPRGPEVGQPINEIAHVRVL